VGDRRVSGPRKELKEGNMKKSFRQNENRVRAVRESERSGWGGSRL